ncbi:cyclic nucleotide-binding domain-containing protein [Cohnella silvisoli]|uniref:Cyclic nucleotide-binding domain-containing protein n=1 Tax=Cohnella silvisoli TaxID=2873699 RepID=A0ABV1KM04_9BACL|nr:cyclic nucleotide-binding domain-containing protein [Cohnella silvisoli]MCD9020587.1 cyclic nucleotide-binding domain-containing protein [Cohnella silvisoli]
MRKIHDPKALRSLMDEHQLSGIFDEKTEAAMELFAFDKGEMVCSVGDRLEHLFMLVKGKIKIYKVLPNGKAILIRFYNPLSTIGDLEMLGELTVKSSVESVNDTLFIGIKQQALVDTAYNDPAFLRFIIKHLAHKLHTFSNASSLNLLYPVETRFASYLVSITMDENDQTQIEEIKTAKLTEIAEMLGTSYRHLNRVISQFAAAGLVERSRGSLFVKDINQLKKLANGNLYS